MYSISYTKEEIKNYLINRSFLQNKSDNIFDVINFYSCIQADPINVVARNHELVLWNRVENFRKQDLYNALYSDKKLFEYWLQLFSIIPIDSYPNFSFRRIVEREWHKNFYEKYKDQISSLIEFVKQNGPTNPKDILHLGKTQSLFSWTNNNSGTALLEYLWDRGILGITNRIKNQRIYDLNERLIPTEYFYDEDEDNSIDFYIKSNFKYLGIVRTPFLNRLGYIRNEKIKNKFDDLLKNDEIVKLVIPGVNTKYYILKNQVIEIEKLKHEYNHEILNILSPLDPFIIDRKILKDIFDFDYSWEAYTPNIKRKVGFYNMPIFYKGEFRGQIDLKKDKNNKLITNKLILKDREKEIKKAIKDNIKELEKFVFEDDK